MSETDGAAAPRRPSPGIKLVLELGPLVLFFALTTYGDRLAAAVPALAVFGGGIFIATAALMATAFLSVLITWIAYRHVATVPLATAVWGGIMGALTLWYHEQIFIMIKLTISEGLIGTLLLVGLLFGKSLISVVFDGAFQLDAAGWRILTFRWGWFFIAIAVINLALVGAVVAGWLTQGVWVSFKVFGTTALSLLFALAQVPVLKRHAIEADNKTDNKTGDRMGGGF